MADSTPSSPGCFEPNLIQGITLVVINIFLVITGTIGNLFIIFAVLETPQLKRRPSNILIMSLALADFLVALCSQSLLAVWLSFATFNHQCVASISLAYDVTVSFLCCCSLFQLGIISIDRAISILKPHRYKDIMTKKVAKRITYGCWIASFLNACSRIAFPRYNFLVGLVIFFGGYIVFIFCYGAIIYKVLQPSGVNQIGPEGSSSARDRVMERRVCEAVGIVTLIFSLCWIPVFLYLLLGGGNTNDVMYSWFRTLYLANSSVNFIVYSWRIQQFRRAYSRIIHKILRRLREMTGLTEEASTAASVGNTQSVDNVVKSEKEKKSPEEL